MRGSNLQTIRVRVDRLADAWRGAHEAPAVTLEDIVVASWPHSVNVDHARINDSALGRLILGMSRCEG